MNEEEQRLLAAAHATLREGQRRLHALSDEARMLYEQRLAEWEHCRHSLESLTALLCSQTANSQPELQQFGNPRLRAKLAQDEALLREKQNELAEEVCGLKRTLRLLSGAIAQMEKETARLQPGSDVSGPPQADDHADANSHERIIHAYEQERLRLAREIHDGPAQILANAIFELEYFGRLLERDPAAVKAQLAQLKSELRDGLADVRRFIFDLRPPALGDMGLFVALRRYLAEYESHFGIAVESSLPEIRERLPATKEVALFRIVQEALQNVQKHAAASKVRVTGEIVGGTLRLSVEDNGRGFDPTTLASRPSKSLGLTSMQERAELIGASLQITAAPGQGTRVSIILPMDGSRG